MKDKIIKMVGMISNKISKMKVITLPNLTHKVINYLMTMMTVMKKITKSMINKIKIKNNKIKMVQVIYQTIVIYRVNRA